MKPEKINFTAMKDVWMYYVWPDPKDHPVPSVDPQQYRGTIDEHIVAKYPPTFFAIKKEKLIIAALGGHKTTDSMYRARGLFLDKRTDEKQYKVLTGSLLSAIREQARSEGCKYIWIYEEHDHPLAQFGFRPTEQKDDKFYMLLAV